MAAIDSINCDILVVGASLGGVAAALSAAELGRQVVLLSYSDWIGGQLTSQGVCTTDEHRYIETFGGTRLYNDLRERIRAHYRGLGLSSAAMKQTYLNVGNSWVSSGFSVEAKVALSILQQMLQPHITDGRLSLYHSISLVPDTCEWLNLEQTAIQSITVNHEGGQIKFTAKYFLDATDLGDLLPYTGTQCVTGAESHVITAEPSAPMAMNADWVQAITFPIAVKLIDPTNAKPISKPPNYDALKSTQNYTFIDGVIDGQSSWVFCGQYPWWTYRRIIAASNFESGVFAQDIATVNVDANDYLGGSIPTSADTNTVLQNAREASMGYLYWMQTECPHDPPNQSHKGYPQIQPDPDFFGTADGLAPDPYVRESRRITALTIVKEQHLSADLNPGPRATLFNDSCGVGDYSIDIHRSSPDMPEIEVSTKPFQIPASALVPVAMTNLLAASKTFGATHIANGAYRVHPTEWNIGESAAALAAFCIANNLQPSAVVAPKSPHLLPFQQGIVQAGIPVYWWVDVPMSHPAFAAVQLLSVQGTIDGGDDLNFRPSDTLSAADASTWSMSAGSSFNWPAGPITRGDAAIYLAKQVGIVG